MSYCSVISQIRVRIKIGYISLLGYLFRGQVTSLYRRRHPCISNRRRHEEVED
jgi:hypothetical protein